ncbi:MAG: beta-galactosidase, partial [Sphaerochaetaceae bacterium]|nr:beta-galactosidase [Sphaerochaetaceae bacterium]
MVESPKLNGFPFGGDYSPEMWTDDVLLKDIELMRELGVNTVTLNVHTWIYDEPEEGKFDFSWLDKTIKRLKKENIGIIMATGTTAPPAWLYQKDHKILKTDIKGRAIKHGVREKFCPTSTTYIEAIKKMVSALANHYKDEESIIAWHLNNELSGFCYCEHCEQEFRLWLKKKYGTIENLNNQWCTAMWGRSYTSFEDIYAPTELNELYLNVNGDGFDLDSLPTEAIEYARFMSNAHKNLFELESTIIKSIIPSALCTNNFQFRDRFNYHEIARPLDFI